MRVRSIRARVVQLEHHWSALARVLVVEICDMQAATTVAGFGPVVHRVSCALERPGLFDYATAVALLCEGADDDAGAL